MVRFPYTLEYLYEEDAIQLPDGMFKEGVREWRSAGRCNAVQNGSGRTIVAKDGAFRAYSYQITRPAGMPPIIEGTPVRVLDGHGRNIFADCTLSAEDAAEASYKVQGNDTRNQRYSMTKLWV